MLSKDVILKQRSTDEKAKKKFLEQARPVWSITD